MRTAPLGAVSLPFGTGLKPKEQVGRMKTVIAGGRDYRLTEDDFRWLDTLGITSVITGGARGVDTGAFDWAWSRRIPVQSFPADWKSYGPAAGPIRNAEMAQRAEQCVLFPGGRGTASMRREAEKRGLKIITRFTPEEMLREVERLIEPLKAPVGTPPELTVKLVDALYRPDPGLPVDAPTA